MCSAVTVIIISQSLLAQQATLSSLPSVTRHLHWVLICTAISHHVPTLPLVTRHLHWVLICTAISHHVPTLPLVTRHLHWVLICTAISHHVPTLPSVTRHLHWVLICTAISHQPSTLGAELLQHSDQIYQQQNPTMMCTALALTAWSVTSSSKRLTVSE